jgi:hypothetical protein
MLFYLFYLEPVFIIIALLASLTLYFQPNTVFYLRIFPLFLLLNASVETVADYLAFHGKHNIFLLNPFTVTAFCFYLFVLRQIIRNSKARKIILHLLWIYPVLALGNIFFIQKPTVFHTMTYSLGCLLVVAVCIYYFLELFQLAITVNLLRQPAFWICSGLLFYFTCTFPIYGFNSLLEKASLTTIQNLMIISDFLNVFLYSSFTIAFLCRFRIRKSM